MTLVNKLYLCRARGLVQAGSMRLSSDEHRAMVEALASADPGRTQDKFFAHVENARGRFQAALGLNQLGTRG